MTNYAVPSFPLGIGDRMKAKLRKHRSSLAEGAANRVSPQ